MKFAKPFLIVATPLGVAGAVYEAFRLAGGLGFLLIALLLMISAAIGMLVMTIREEKKAAGQEGQPPRPPGGEGST
jgi:hypothetical protein